MSGLLQIFAKESSLDLWSKASKNRDFLTVLYSVLLSALSGVCGSQLPFEGIEGVVVGTSRRPARSINRPPWQSKHQMVMGRPSFSVERKVTDCCQRDALELEGSRI